MTVLRGKANLYLLSAVPADPIRQSLGLPAGLGDEVILEPNGRLHESRGPLPPRWRADRARGGAFQGAKLLIYRCRKVDEHEMAPVIEVILATFIDDTHKVILGGLRIRENLIDLATYQRRLVVGVVDADRERLRR